MTNGMRAMKTATLAVLACCVAMTSAGCSRRATAPRVTTFSPAITTGLKPAGQVEPEARDFASGRVSLDQQMRKGKSAQIAAMNSIQDLTPAYAK